MFLNIILIIITILLFLFFFKKINNIVINYEKITKTDIENILTNIKNVDILDKVKNTTKKQIFLKDNFTLEDIKFQINLIQDFINEYENFDKDGTILLQKKNKLKELEKESEELKKKLQEIIGEINTNSLLNQ